MSTESLAQIMHLLDACKDLTLATVRADGSPQANIVSYGHDGLTLYFATDRDSQKIRNLQACDKVSLALRPDYDGWSTVKALSITATARILADDSAEAQLAKECLARRFRRDRSSPSPQDQAAAVLVMIVPSEICVIDYSKGYGHHDVVRVPEAS